MAQTAPYDTDTSDMLIPHGVFRQFFNTADAVLAHACDRDRDRVAAAQSYFDNVLRFLDAHHGGEDELLWPLLTARCSDSELIRRMEDEHETIHRRRAEAETALEAWYTTPTGTTADALTAALTRLHAEVERHFGEEENEILPLASRYVSPEEWGALPGHAMSHFSGDKIWLILGLVFEQMTPEVRAVVIAHMPRPVIDMWNTSGQVAFEDFVGRVRPLSRAMA